MSDPLDNYLVYNKANKFYDKMIKDTEILLEDQRGINIAKQLIKSTGSICANIEEGYGRGTRKEFLQYLRIARGSARESKGWYSRSKFLLHNNVVESRKKEMDEIIAILVSMIDKLEHSEK